MSWNLYKQELHPETTSPPYNLNTTFNHCSKEAYVCMYVCMYIVTQWHQGISYLILAHEIHC